MTKSKMANRHSPELRACGQNGVDLIGDSFKHVLQEFSSGLPVWPLDELSYGKFSCAVNAEEQK